MDFKYFLEAINKIITKKNLNTSSCPKKPMDQKGKDLCWKVIAEITKAGFRIHVNPTFLRTVIKELIQKKLKLTLTKSALKNIPVGGIITGISFGAWRALNREYNRAVAQVVSGFLGATGIGIGPSIAIDIGIIIADIIDFLEKNGYIQQIKPKL